MKLAAHLKQSKLLYLKQGCENLSVAENEHYRWLLFDNVVQSVMLKRVPFRLTIPHQYFLMLPLLFSSPKNIIELGLGGGNLIRFLNHILPETEILSIEYNQQVIDCFDTFFNPQKIHQPIINISFEMWLSKKKRRQLCGWLIYDIYQTDEDPQYFLKQITRILNKIDDNAWLSINLPDLNEHELNIALLHLSSIKQKRIMRYFQVPHYKNIIIHLAPVNDLLDTENSLLPGYAISRWSRLWLQGMVNR
jgi:spermidine synthase